MIFFVGGAPRTGKTILGQHISAKLKIGWISTDLLWEVLKVKNEEAANVDWNAAPEVITRRADWFFPCLERFVWGVNSKADSYLIEGVNFLPSHIAQLSATYPVRAVFLGCFKMTLARFDNFPGHSRGYAALPEAVRRQFAADIPPWSRFIQQEAERFNYPFIDMSDDFQTRLNEAGAHLTHE